MTKKLPSSLRPRKATTNIFPNPDLYPNYWRARGMIATAKLEVLIEKFQLMLEVMKELDKQNWDFTSLREVFA